MNLIITIANKFSSSPLGHGKAAGILSVIGMGVGCFALIISLAVMNGFEFIVNLKLKGFDGDVRVSGAVNDLKLGQLEQIDGVMSAMPYMERRGLINDEEDYRVVSLKAVDMNKLEDFYSLTLRGASSENEILIGQDLAYRLGKDIGDQVEISSPIDQSFGLGFPPRKKLKISGVFSTRILDYDDRYVFIPLGVGQSLFKRKRSLDGFDLRLDGDQDVDSWKINHRLSLPEEITIQTWKDLNRSLVEAMRLERVGAIAILSLIFLVAAFNLAATLSLISIQKMKETGILRIMGASSIFVKRILLTMGLKKGFKGALFGLIVGMAVVLIQSVTGFIPIPADIYFINSLPMVLYTGDVITITLIAIIFIFVSSWLASQKVARIDPKEALQWVK